MGMSVPMAVVVRARPISSSDRTKPVATMTVATISAATDLFGAGSNQVAQLANTWTAVGVLPGVGPALTVYRDKLAADYAASAANLKTLQASYNALEKNSDDALQTNMTKNRELLAQLETKEKALAAEQDRLNKLKADFEERSNRVAELEKMMSDKEASMKKLKESLSKALNAFEGKGLTVEQKNGKVYVSMENKLLFQTGSWAVGTEGRKAVVELGKVLGQNPDISVLIEGHTDNDKFAGAMGQIENNWDLSTKRATAIVNILSENKAINKQNLTAAGRGEFAPIASNDTPEGKSKNRRIEFRVSRGE